MTITFKTFLIESEEKANLLLHKIIDMVDDAHVEYSDEKISMNIGSMTKNSELRNLELVIRKSKSYSARLAKNKNNSNISIVIDTSSIPERKDIDNFLSKANNSKNFVKLFNEYLAKYHSGDTPHDKLSSYEKSKTYNTKEQFDKEYDKLNKYIRDKLEEYNKVKTDIENQIKSTHLAGRKHTLELSLKHLEKEYIGNSAKEFISIMLKGFSGEFVEHLSPENKKKLMSRLTSYYEQIAS